MACRWGYLQAKLLAAEHQVLALAAAREPESERPQIPR